MKPYDLVVIGGGPGGYVAAVRATQLGLNTALVEKEALGGTCLNWGCVPTKSLLRNGEVIHLLSKGRTFGFSYDNLDIDYSAAHKRSRSVVKRQTRRVAALMKNSGVDVYEDSAYFTGGNTIELADSGEILEAKNFVIATGAKSRQLPCAPYDGENVISFRQALSMTVLPKTAVIVGAGPIGMEFATVWNSYGTKVTVVEAMASILPLEDEDVCLEAEKQFKKNGIAIKTGALVENVNLIGDTVKVTVKTEKGLETVVADTVMVSIGFIPNTQDLGLEKAGVDTIRAAIEVDETMRTSASNIYAIGDVNAQMGLAHVASAQAMIAIDAIVGKTTTPIVYHNVPRCVYGRPEVASVGMTEKQARENGFEVTTAQCPFLANGKAMGMDDNVGFVKIVSDAATKKVLGVHMIGGHVTELISGPTGLIFLDGTIDDIGNTVHPHPTLSEAIMEAAHKLSGHAIHI
jgi:dihydrolipoamide dehydrogenase